MKKLNTILNLSLISLIILFSNSCKKKNTREYYRINIGEEPKGYLWSKAGSYWIYKNTLSGDLDTQTCTGFIFETIISKGTTEENKHITSEWERIQRNIYSSFHKRSYFDHTGLKEPDDPNFNNGYTVLDRSYYGGSNNCPFFYPFEKSAGITKGGSNTGCGGMDSTLTIQGIIYSNVVMFNINIESVEALCTTNYSVSYYWGKDVGLVKKTVHNCNYSWELIEYKIIK